MFSFREHVQINEVFLVGKKAAGRGDVVVAFRQWVWIVDDDNLEELKPDMVKKLKLSKSEANDIEDPYSWESYVNEEGQADIIAGTVTNGILSITTMNWRQSSASKTLEKMMKALKVRSVEINFFDEEEDDFILQGREEFLIPLAKKTFFHGTSYLAIRGGRGGSMLVKGIMPTPGKTNFGKITHKDKVFITLNKEKALFHAQTAARVSESFPVIISLTIPDPAKLVLDYDVALNFYGATNPRTTKLGFTDIKNFAAKGNKFAMAVDSDLVQGVARRQRKNPEDLNTKLGIFGYIGRIAATNFIDVYLDQDAFAVWFIENEVLGSGESPGSMSGVSSWRPVPAKKFNKWTEDIEKEFEEETAEVDDEDI